MNKTLLVTGGTGSFGNAFVKKFLKSKTYAEIRIFSRDESKQVRMARDYNNSKLSFFLGDIRDEERITQVCKGVDVIFHAAALKQVPSCENATWETIKTNISNTYKGEHTMFIGVLCEVHPDLDKSFGRLSANHMSRNVDRILGRLNLRRSAGIIIKTLENNLNY